MWRRALRDYLDNSCVFFLVDVDSIDVLGVYGDGAFTDRLGMCHRHFERVWKCDLVPILHETRKNNISQK